MNMKWWGVFTIVTLLALVIIGVIFDITTFAIIIGVWLGVAAYMTMEMFMEDCDGNL